MLRAAVSGTRGMFPAKRVANVSWGARLAAFQQCVWECDHACAGCSDGRCGATLRMATGPMGKGAGVPDGEWALNPADRYGIER